MPCQLLWAPGVPLPTHASMYRTEDVAIYNILELIISPSGDIVLWVGSSVDPVVMWIRAACCDQQFLSGNLIITADLGSIVGLDRARTADLGSIVDLARLVTVDLGQKWAKCSK